MDSLSRFDSVGCDEPENPSKFIIPHIHKMLKEKIEKSIKLTSTNILLEENIVCFIPFTFQKEKKIKQMEKQIKKKIEENDEVLVE